MMLQKFGKSIRMLRNENGYSQEKLAELADLDRSYIHGIEAGKRNVSLIVLKKLATAFNVSLSELTKDI